MLRWLIEDIDVLKSMMGKIPRNNRRRSSPYNSGGYLGTWKIENAQRIARNLRKKHGMFITIRGRKPKNGWKEMHTRDVPLRDSKEGALYRR